MTAPVTTPLRVLVIGAGARDHALLHAFHASPLCGELHVAPGNVGMESLATVHDQCALDDLESIVGIALELRPDLVVVGPEDLLVAGLATMLHDAGLCCLGPGRDAAQLEGSKAFAKTLMDAVGVPTPTWRACSSVDEARAAVVAMGGAVAVKADGLAAGCGAYVCRDERAAFDAIDELMVERVFGDSGSLVIIEQLVNGNEASVMALVDGDTVVPLPPARDYKRLRNDDEGPNTGGMGAAVPNTAISEREATQLAHDCIGPVARELVRRGTPFRGVIYAGVMLTAAGPQVLEYNCRFGNPETQALVRVLDDDLLALIWNTARGELADTHVAQPRGHAVAVCVAAEHYPAMQLEPTPVRVRGIERAAAVDGVEVFCGFARQRDGNDDILSLGGRVVTISAWGDTCDEAVSRAYEAVACIDVPGGHFRRDIGIFAMAAAESVRS